MFSNKKILFPLLISILFMVTFSSFAYASEGDITPRASEYIRSTGVNLIPQVNGKIIIETDIGATRLVDQLGIKKLTIQVQENGYWRSIETLVSDSYKYDVYTFVYDTIYYGTPGTSYRAYVEFYVEDAGGSEMKIVTSSPVTAQY